MAKGQIKQKLDEITVVKLEWAFGTGSSVSEACIFAGISRDTYYRWSKEYPELSDRFELLKQRPILLARQTVVENLKKDVKLAFKYLERKVPEEFGVNHQRKSDFKSSYTHSIPIEIKYTYLTTEN